MEHTIILTDEQEKALVTMTQAFNDRPLPPNSTTIQITAEEYLIKVIKPVLSALVQGTPAVERKLIMQELFTADNAKLTAVKEALGIRAAEVTPVRVPR